jgi:hypothetical protein
MKRTVLTLGVVAVMAAMLVALAAPAMAKDNDSNGKNNGHHNNNNGNSDDGNNGGNKYFDNRLDRIENRVDDWFDNRHDDWFDSDRDDVNIRYVSDGDDFDGFYPYWGWYGGCGFDWDGPVTPADCWD